VTGGDPIENKGDGIYLDHDERYVLTREFLDVYRAAGGRRRADRIILRRNLSPDCGFQELSTATPVARSDVLKWRSRNGDG
jgi:alkanesulfonate monooxygenase SsuD/methylene tetrahydromethanopterin reductase-like flavin-dependent oxidoreductase (luciferase family)